MEKTAVLVRLEWRAEQILLFGFYQFFFGQFNILQDLCQQAWADSFTGMDRHYRCSTVRMLYEYMTSLLSDGKKALLFQ